MTPKHQMVKGTFSGSDWNQKDFEQNIKNSKLSRQSTMRLGWNSWLGDLMKTNPDSVMLEFRLDENRL